MSFKKILKGFLLAYGTVTLIERHGDDVAKWLEKKAAEIGRKAGNAYAESHGPVERPRLIFQQVWYVDMKEHDSYYTAVGNDGFDLLEYEFLGTPSDVHNFESHDCYILVEE